MRRYLEIYVFYITIMQKFSIIVEYVKRLNFKFLIGLGLFCIFAAIVNNHSTPDNKSVEWLGGQKVLEKPE
jgi:hypothetical protein